MMDYNMLYVLGIVFGVCVLTYVISVLRKKEIITQTDLSFVQQLFSLSVAIIDELNLKNEDKILQISNVVLSALEYATSISSGAENITEKALEKCYELCEQFEIELTASRKLILQQLVTIGLQNRYIENSKGRYRLAE